jgi:phytanoyl-CoA hydroxylase
VLGSQGEVTVKPFQQYAAEGWSVVRRAIPEPLVRELAARFIHDAKPCADPQLRQNSRVEPNKLDAFGFMKVPLLDPHLGTSAKLTGFRTAILDLACSAAMLEALATVTLRPQHLLQQLMVFEQAATPPHQDWVYLDSYPQGCLTAAWVALEDISPKATRFFIVSGSQDFDREFPSDWIFGSSRYVEAMKEVVQTQFADSITIPEMYAGDVLFWNSRLIHGSLAGEDPSRSRLSLAAHYIPEGFGFGNRGTPLRRAYPLPVVTGRPIPYTCFSHPTAQNAEAAKSAPSENRKANWMRGLLRRLKSGRVFGAGR